MIFTSGGTSTASRSRLEGTPQQEAFFGALTRGDGNIVLEARAGTGKSASCREGMWRILEQDPSASIRYCCFNKKIAEEFKEKCPPRVEVGTMHSFGLRALQKSLNRPQIEKNKSYILLDAMPRGAKLQRWIRRAIVQVVSIAKNHALGPGEPGLATTLDELVTHYEIETWGRQEEVVDWACDVLERSAETVSMIDFDDMLWLPLYLMPQFPRLDYLFVDECQDLNATQHALLLLLNQQGRTIVVGDPYQAIYMWRGAAAGGMDLLKEQLEATTMPLTVTWRCPFMHVELAKRYVPDFEAAPDAPGGEVVWGKSDSLESAPPGSLVLCRNNAPNIAACLRLIAQRKRASVRGRSIGEQLGSIVRRVEAATIPSLVRGIQSWKAKQIERLEEREGTEDLIESIADRAAALEAICDSCSSPAEVPAVIDAMFSDEDSANRINFSSVHRAKGSEAQSVYYLQSPTKPPINDWQAQQSRNIEYVALTRSLHSLTFCPVS